jgi:4-hydroxybenzoate polyprenyltransferase
LASLIRKASDFIELVKLQHTLFALPFAMVSLVLAAPHGPSFRQLLWILGAMVGARSSAMAMNRIADRHIDAQNPRTRGRALPAGILGLGEVWVFTLASTALFLWSAWQLSALALALSPVALSVLWGYSFTKRFTALSHLVLGLALGIAPSAVWIALLGRLDWTPVLLTLAVTLWTAGFDILYACQDVEFDRQVGLHSIPTKLGIAQALLIARLLHVGMALLLAGVGFTASLGPIYWIGLLPICGLLFLQHRLVSPQDLSRLNAAFFTTNGFLSVGLLVVVLLDRT